MRLVIAMSRIVNKSVPADGNNSILANRKVTIAEKIMGQNRITVNSDKIAGQLQNSGAQR